MFLLRLKQIFVDTKFGGTQNWGKLPSNSTRATSLVKKPD